VIEVSSINGSAGESETPTVRMTNQASPKPMLTSR
jgi:hypothetical protein